MLEGALGDAQDGNIALVDWRTAQDVLGLRGRMSRVDIMLGNAAGVADVIEILQSRIGSVATVRKRDIPTGSLRGCSSYYQTGMWAVGAIGDLVSLLLLFSISASSVDRKSEEFRLLHAVGMSLSRLRRLVVLEAILLCGGAVGLGLALAPLLAGLTMERLASTSRLIHGSRVATAGISWSSVAVAVGTAALILGFATVGPALRAVRRAGQSAAAIDETPSDRRGWIPATGRDGPYRNMFLAPAFIGFEGTGFAIMFSILGGAVVVEVVSALALRRSPDAFLPPVLSALMPRVGAVVSSAIRGEIHSFGDDGDPLGGVDRSSQRGPRNVGRCVGGDPCAELGLSSRSFADRLLRGSGADFICPERGCRPERSGADPIRLRVSRKPSG